MSTVAKRGHNLSSNPRGGSVATVIVPDMHVPHHDQTATAVVRKLLERLDIERVVCLGDGADMTPFSRFGYSSMVEVQQLLGSDYLNDFLLPLKAEIDGWYAAGVKRVDYLEGNHENWISRWCANAGPAGQALWSLVSPVRVLGSERTKKTWSWTPYIPHPEGDSPSFIEVFPESEHNLALWACHGWSHARSAAKQHLSKVHSQVCVVHGHTHRADATARAIEPVRKREVFAWSPGCLSKRQPFYKHGAPTDYSHGVTLCYGKRDRSKWAAYHVRINGNYCILPGGEEIRV